jgi:hypothetical protein
MHVPSVLQASAFRSDVTAFRLMQRWPADLARNLHFGRNTAEPVYLTEAAHNPGSQVKSCPRYERPWKQRLFLGGGVAERGLRAAVIYRKLSLGSRSQGGERTIERLLSVDQSFRLQRRSLYAYLADALTAEARGDPVSSLMGA